jgi:hypothetical protein
VNCTVAVLPVAGHVSFTPAPDARPRAAQDLAAAHDEAERLTGEKAALGGSVKQLAGKVRKLEGFKQMLVSNLAEEHGGALPRGLSAEALPDSDALLADILANAKPASLPARPSLARIESRARRCVTCCRPLLASLHHNMS